MKPRTTIILLIIAALIGGFVWYDTKHLKDTPGVESQAKRLFPDTKSGDITKLEIHNTNGVIVVEKSGEKLKEKWDMKKPYEVRASKSDIESILNDLEFLDSERAMTPKELKEAGATPASYGLEKPRVEAIVTIKGTPRIIKLGDESKVGGNLYAMVDGRENVYVIGKSLFDKLNKSVDDLRDRTVVEFSTSDLTRLELKSGNRQIELSKSTSEDSGETWRVTRPITARADKQTVDDIATKLSELKVETFVTEDPKDLKLYGLDEPRQEVSLITKGAEVAPTMQFGAALTNDATKVYAKRKLGNSVFTVKSDILTNLVLQVNDLRDRKLAEFESDQVHAVELQLGAQTARLTHHTNQWNILEPPGLKPEESACTDMLDHIRDAEVKEFVADVVADLAQFGLDKPVVQITLKKEKIVTMTRTNEPPKVVTSTNAPPAMESVATTNMVPLVTIQVGKTDPAKGLVYVKRADEAFVYGLDTNFVSQLPRSILDLRERTILSLDPSAIRKVEVTRGGVAFVVEQATTKDTNGVENTDWKLVTPAQGVLSIDAVDSAVSELSHIEAEKLIAENPANLAEFGLDQPAVTVNFVAAASTNETPVTRTLLLGKETTDKKRFAMLKGNPLVFELSSDASEKLTNDFLTKPEEKPAPQAASTNAPPAK